MRSIKIVAGLVLIFIALFVIIKEQTAGVSADAFVNARLTTTRAPIAGTFELVSRPLGARIDRGDTIGTIVDPLVDNVRLADLNQQRLATKAELDRLNATAEGLTSSIEELQTRAENYQRERIEQLKSQIDGAQASAKAAEARLRYARLSLDRSNRLSDQGVRTGEALEQSRSLAEVAELDLANAQETVRSARINLAAAERGIFLGDGYNDAPYSEQRISELEVQRDQLQASAAAQASVLEALDARIRAEQLRVNRLSSASLQANVSGLIWDYLAVSGEAVQRGQDLVTLVDCQSTIVTLSVTERVYNGITLGSSAQFRMNGSDQLLSGVVTRVAGSGASTVYENLAIAPSERHLERFDVTLDVPALRQEPELFCLIGRTGRVFFEDRPLDWLRRVWN
ncbi:HlyD family secretion protein [Rhizobium rosettiformans]|uniref:HlyD family secretion protein n=1 Tax=Rhizobium rosettiformans TaxID=1368430 RepID=UPI000DE24289|nr:HlyD family efflux transporter periplasmic adaptor subunit [Rhizobium rosettiformans]MDR7031211.1 multidrug resistance efflux pump [Rhizobium rosettiformans]MDR7067077.1 multidrug resistance efflux pump [Rhizobium rosettiformans]